MPLFINEKPFVNGSNREFAVFPDRVRSHLMIIASTSLTDFEASFGDTPVDSDGDGVAERSQVDYSPQIADPNSDAGKVRTNLKALVDRAGSSDIFGVDSTWVVSRGGDTMSSTPAIQLGSTVIYDTSQANGQGRWMIAADGSKKCVMDAEILYHELVHVVKNHGGSLDPAAAAAEEREARVEEGAFERSLGRPARHADRAEAGVGCSGDGPCCIVASVASESPYAPDVVALRSFRDRVVRGTQLGIAWFDLLHDEYYTFSVPMCRAMVLDDGLREDVAAGLVAPLVQALELVTCWIDDDDPVRLATMLRDMPSLPPVDVDRITGAFEPLRTWLPRSPHVRWALIDLVALRIELGLIAADVDDLDIVGRTCTARLSQWLGGVPLEAALARCGAGDESDRDLLVAAFAEAVLRSPSACDAFPAVRV